MNLKSSKSGFKKENVNPNYYVHCCFIGCHGNSLLNLGLNTIISYGGLYYYFLGGG